MWVCLLFRILRILHPRGNSRLRRLGCSPLLFRQAGAEPFAVAGVAQLIAEFVAEQRVAHPAVIGPEAQRHGAHLRCNGFKPLHGRELAAQ